MNDDQKPQNDENTPLDQNKPQVDTVVDQTATGADPNQVIPPEVVVVAHQNRRKIIIIVVVVAVLIVGVAAFAVTNKSQKSDTKTSSDQAPQQITTANVSITASSVSPATVEIKKGQSVTWKNNDTKDHQIAADPYPTNSSLPELGKSVVLKPGDTFSYIYESTGSFSYHDNLDPYKIQGVVVVKE